MKIIRYAMLVIFAGVLSCVEPGAERITPNGKKVKELVWSDEFDGNKLDTNKWNYEIGFVRNKEQQYYTNDQKNVSVHDGYLEIKVIKEDYPNKNYKEGKGEYIGNKLNIPTAHYTSGSINTKDKYSVKYGRIEMRAKLPQGKGVWPAFWLLGADYPQVKWPDCGEIDIMEYVGISPDVVKGSIHFSGNDRHVGEGETFSVKTPSDYHVYAIEWNDRTINYYVDENLYWREPLTRIDKYFPGKSETFKKDYYILLNLALGGLWGNQQMTIDDKALPQSYKVDYVRVYKMK